MLVLMFVFFALRAHVEHTPYTVISKYEAVNAE